MAELKKLSLFSDASLQGYWRMENNWNDEGPHGYHLTPVNSPTFVDAKYGKGGHFVANNSQYATIVDASCPALEIAGAQTWIAWHKNVSYANYETIMAKSPVGGSLKGLSIDGYNNLVDFTLTGLGSNSGIQVAMPQDGLVHQYIGRYYSAGSNLSIWIDGVKAGEVYATGSANDTNGDFSIGRRGAWAQFQNGDSDDCAIFSRSLTDAELLLLFKEQIKARSINIF